MLCRFFVSAWPGSHAHDPGTNFLIGKNSLKTADGTNHCDRFILSCNAVNVFGRLPAQRSNLPHPIREA
jgi:hypothetical protein